MVIRVWDFILIGLIRDEKSSPPRLTYLACSASRKFSLPQRDVEPRTSFACPALSPHTSLWMLVCVCIHYHFQKASVFSFSFGAVTITFSIYFIFISSILIGLVKHLQPTPNPAYIMGQPMIQPRPTPLPSCWIVI